MAIVVDDNVPDFLREFLTSQGVISVKDTETGETGIVRIPPRRRRRGPEQEQAGGLDEEYTNPQVTSASSGSLSDFLSGLLSSDTPMSAEDIATNQALAEAAERDATSLRDYSLERGIPLTYAEAEPNWNQYQTDPDYNIMSENAQRFAEGRASRSFNELMANAGYQDPTVSLTTSAQDLASLSSGNSVLDGAANVFSSIGNFVGGLFNTDNTAGALSPVDPADRSLAGLLNPAFDDKRLSSGRMWGQGLGTGLMGLASLGNPLFGPFNIAASILGEMGFHHNYDPSRDYNLNFDVNSGRFEWDTSDPAGTGPGGIGGVSYGSKANEQMIIDEANENPHQQFNVTFKDEEGNEQTRHTSFGEAKNILDILNDPGFTGNTIGVWSALSSPGKHFGSQESAFGYGTNDKALIDFHSGYGGDLWNAVAGEVYNQGGGYNSIYGPMATAAEALALNVSPTPQAIEAMVGDSLQGTEWAPSTLALASQPDLIYDIDTGAGGGGDGGDSGGSGQQDSGGEIGMFDMDGPF